MSTYDTPTKVTLTANASPNTKATSWTEIDASTSLTVTGILLTVGITSTAADFLIDIATGAAAAESIVIPDFYYPTGPTNQRSAASVYIPISIASGTRISARCQSTTGGATIDVQITLINDTTPDAGPATTVVAYGPNTTDSGAAGVDPGASAGTKGGYTELSASLSEDANWLIVVVGARVNLTMTTANWFIDIATGASLSEVVLIPDLFLTVNASTDMPLPTIHAFPCALSAGTRVAVRASCTTNDGTDRLIDVAIYTVNLTPAAGGGSGGEGPLIGGRLVL